MQKREQGSVHIIVVSILAIMLVGALGFVFWQNFIQPKPSGDSAALVKTNEHNKQNKSNPESTTVPVAQAKSFKGGYGVDWISFDYPADWTIGPDVEISGTGPDVGPGIIIKSPGFKIVDYGQGQGPSGNFIIISSTKHWNGSISYWKSQQQPANPESSFGHFTFAGKPAVIWRGTTAQDTTTPPMATMSDMYKGENTWIQGNGIIYTFYGSIGDHPPGNKKELLDAIKILLDSWKWR